MTVSFALAALASCGGGGGGGAGGPAVPAATLQLTAANAQNVAGDAALAGMQTAERGGSLLAAAAVQGAPARTHVLSRFLEREIAQLLVPHPAPLAGLVTTTACLVSGTKTEDQGANSVVESFNACSDVAGESLSGSIVISAISATASTFSASMSVSLTFSFTGVTDLSFSGSFALAVTGIGGTSISTTISGSQLLVQQGSNIEQLAGFTLTTTVDQSTSGVTDSVTFTYASTEIGGSVTVTTLTPFQTDPGRQFPHVGAIQITGANGSKIRLTVNGDETGATPQVTIQLDTDGDGVFELTLNKNWSDLTA